MAPTARLTGSTLANMLPAAKDMPGPAYAALARAVAQLVLDGRIPVETRLPSERDLAVSLGRSRATITGAYDQLRADGFLDSRTGAGSFVAVPAGSTPRTHSGWRVATSTETVIDLSITVSPAPAGFGDAAAEAVDDLGAHLLSAGLEPAGIPALRTAVAERFERRGVPTRPDQIFVTNGALHGLDLVLRLLLAPGDRVVTEIPNYPSAVSAIRGNGGRVVPAPIAAQGGWHTEQLESVLHNLSPRLAYLTPDFHNPSGALVPTEQRRAVLTAARRAGTTVVVDETFVDLGFRPPETPMVALDSGVVTIGSLSKSVWGGVRIGWVRGSAELVQRLAALRCSIDIGGPILEQLVAVRLLERLDEIAAGRVAALRPQDEALRAALAAELPGWRAGIPQGGLSLWVELDAALSTPLTVLAERRGVILVPGSRFGVDGTLERFLRIPYSLPVDRLQDAVSRIAEVWRDLDGGTHSGPSRLVVA